MKIIGFIALWFLLWSGSILGQTLTREQVMTHVGRGDPFRGSDKAPVLLIEFSDFQCSFCRKFWEKTLPSIDGLYIKTGKVKFVYRHFAILGNHSTAAALASECAGEQGQFWPYHDRLFARVGSPLAFTHGKLVEYARKLKLKEKVFKECLDSSKYLKKVEGETSIAVFLGARGTPTFFLNGQLMVGAQPFEVFEEVIEKELQNSPVRKGKR